MSTPGPFDPGDADPFKGVPFFGDLARLLQGQGGFRWDTARQLAHQIATEGTSEPNPDPLTRIKLEQLARVAELHVAQATGLATSVTGRPVTVVPVNRTLWVHTSADAYQPLFESLAASLGRTPPADEIAAAADPADPMGAWLTSLMGAVAPMMLSMTAGSLLGHLARRCFGQYDLPIPRPPSDELMLVMPNVSAFGEAWSLAEDDLLLWVCVHEMAHHAVLGVPHVREALSTLLSDYAAGFEPDAGGLEDRLGDFRPDDPSSMAGLQEVFGDPEVLLGAIRSDAQRALLPRLEALVSVIIGYVDHVMDSIGEQLIGSYGMLTEALRRHRVESDPADRFVERLLGLELTPAAVERGAAFVAGVQERAGAAGLERLWRDARELPTPAEVDAPGLWLARIDLPGDEG